MRKNFSSLGLTTIGLLNLLLLGSACNNGNNTPSTQASTITTSQFMTQLVADANNGQISATFSGSNVAKATTMQAGYFVIWDSSTQSYQAVNLGFAEQAGLSAQQAVQAFVAANGTTQLTAQSSNPFAPQEIVTGDTYGVVPVGSCCTTMGEIPVYSTVNPLVTVTSYGTTNAGQPIYQDASGTLYSQNGNTRDTDLQQAQLRQQSSLQRAANVSTTYQMSFSSALQITLLADKINTITEQALTDEDRQAITQTTLSIAGISSEELTQATQASMTGNDGLSNALVSKVATNLGMPSDSTLRYKILPSLGVSLSPGN